MHKDESVIDEEIKKFSKLADQWWDPNGKFKVLHDFNHARLSFITHVFEEKFSTKLTDKTLQTYQALDIGCGGGILAESLSSLGLNVIGIDASLPSIRSAQIHGEKVNSKVEYIHSTIEHYINQNPQNQFDFIFAMEIIEHVNNPAIFLKNVLSLLKPDGILFISTINKNIKSLLTAKIAAEYILKWLPQGTHNFNKFISPATLNSMLNDHNAYISKIKGIKYNIFLKLWNIADKPSVNYIVAVNKNS